MPHVLCRLPRDQHQRGGRLADLAEFAGNRRSRHRTLARPAAAGSLDGEPKMATTVTLATWIKERFLASLEMTNKLFCHGAPPSCHLERSERSYRLERSFSCSQFLKAS